MAAWIRDERDPAWFASLPSTVKNPAKKSLKFLTKTNDSFFTPTSVDQPVLEQADSQWLEMAAEKSVSKQIIALRHFTPDDALADQQSEILLGKLRSGGEPIVLHAITAIEALKLDSQPIVDQLNHLIEHSNDEIRAKAAIALAKIGHIDEHAVTVATKMIDSRAKHVVYGGMFALASQPQVDDATLRAVDRGFLSALQTCDYEFIQLYASAYANWLDDPEKHFATLLSGAEEYVEIATDALQTVREQAVALG